MGQNRGLKEKTVSGLFWRFAERCGAKGVELIVSIVLARLLSPDVYGVVAMVTVFITLSQVFVDSGMGNALIQKKDSDDLDFSTVFYFNIALCLTIYSIVFLMAPYIAQFYANESLTWVLRILAITIILSALKNVQQSYVSKHMLFKKFFFSTLIGTIVAACVGIILAYNGAGVWALVAQQIVNVFIDTLVLWITVKWRPKLLFSISRLKTLFSYGWKLLLSSLINTFYNNMRQLVIGKVYSSSDLAYYNRGRQFPNLIVTNINSSIDSVLLPAMASEQDDIGKVKNITRRAIKTSGYIMWPMMIGLAVLANPITCLLLTDKWAMSIPYLRIFCIIFAFEPIQTANLNAIKALGRSDLFLKLEIIKKTVGIGILLLTMSHGVLSIALGMLVYTIIASILNASPNLKLLNYSYIEQIKDMFPSIILSVLMALIVFPVTKLGMTNLLTVICGVVLGGTVYVVGSILFRFEAFYYIYGLAKAFLKRQK